MNGSDLFRGKVRSKVLFFLSLVFLCIAGITLVSKTQTYDPVTEEMISSRTPWKITILLFVLSFITSFIAYRLAGGRQNPAIWKDKNLNDLLKHAALSGQARIGLYALRDQEALLNKLESIGLRKRPAEDIRQFIRDKIVRNRRAFDICQDNIIIQMIHQGKEWFWDGYGNKKTAQYFHEAEIIFDLEPSLDYMFSEVLEGLKEAKGIKEEGSKGVN